MVNETDSETPQHGAITAPFPIDNLELWGVPLLDLDHVVAEDDALVDNIVSTKIDPLYNAYPLGAHIFFANSSVGLFATLDGVPLVPNMLLGLDLQPHQDWWAKEYYSYRLYELEAELWQLRGTQ